jgi:hypothetical protein
MAASRKPPAHLTYVYISAAAFACALAAAGLLIAFSDRLVFISNAVYYVVLLPLALAAAAFLFGAMRSHARYRGTVANGTLELGGPVVVFALVMLGGLLLANPDSTGSVTVRLTSTAGPEEPISHGEVVLDLGDDRRTRSVGPDGQATFAQVPASFLSGEVGVIARVDRYRMARPGPFRVSPAGVIEVPMEPVAAETVVAGFVFDANGPLRDALVNFANGLVTARTDANGNFRVTLPLEDGASVPVTVTVEGRTVYDDSYVVSPATSLRVRVAEEDG